MRIEPKDRLSIFSRRRLRLLASVAAIAGAQLLLGPAGYFSFSGAAAMSPAPAAERAGPASFADVVTKGGHFGPRQDENRGSFSKLK
jgi:hypothetical protein